MLFFLCDSSTTCDFPLALCVNVYRILLASLVLTNATRFIVFCRFLSSKGKMILTDRKMKAAKELRIHLEAGCLTDPDPRQATLYHWLGRTIDGVDKFRSSQATNRLVQ